MCSERVCEGHLLCKLSHSQLSLMQSKKFQSQWTVKYRSRVLGQGACLKGMSRTITIQGFRLTAITDVEKT